MTASDTPTPSSMTNRDVAVLLGILILALVVRIGFWVSAKDLTLFQEPTGDAATYVQLADELARDGLLAPEGKPYERAPLYPLYLRLLRDSLGLEGARMLQFLLGVAGVGLLWVLGRRVAGRIGAVVAALGGALYGPFVFFESELLSISLAVFFLELALVLWGRPRWALMSGALVGLCALAQPNFLLAGILIGAAGLLRPPALGWRTRRLAGIFVLGLVLAPSFSLARNWAVSGEPILISTSGGINFYIGNHPGADGTFQIPPESGLIDRPEGLFISAREVAEEKLSRPLSHREVDRYWWMRGFDFWLLDAGRAVGLTLGKALLAVNRTEIPSHYDYDFLKEEIPLLRVLPAMGILFPLGAVGLLIARRQGRLPLVVMFLAFLIAVIPFFITARYRLPLAVFLWPAAGLAVRSAWELRGNLRGLGFLAGTVGLYGVLAFMPFYQGGSTRAHMLSIEGMTLLRQGDLLEGRRTIEAALAAEPNHAEALSVMAYLLELEGNPQDAAEYYRRALIANPADTEPYLGLEAIYRRAGRYPEALEALNRFTEAREGRLGDKAAVVKIRRGLNVMSLGDTAAAEALLQEAVAEDSTLVDGWVGLSLLHRALDRPAQALAAMRRAAELVPQSQEIQMALGDALETAGHLTEAGNAYSTALRLGPPNAELSYRMGRILLRTGRPEYLEAAEGHLTRASEGRSHPEALLELGRLYERTNRRAEAESTYTALTRLDGPLAAAARARLEALGRP